MSSIHIENNNNCREINVLLSDFGEEIDDEVALFCAMFSVSSSNSTWYVVCVPGASSTDPEKANQEVRKRMIRVSELFPCFENVTHQSRNDWTMQWTNENNATFIVGPPSMIVEKDTSCIDNLIRIAPLWHIEPEYFQKFDSIKKYIVMGDLSNPNQSINLTKAIPENNESLKLQYQAQENVITDRAESILSIPTSLARKVPIPYKLLNKLPECLKDPLLDTAFDQCVGRVPAHLGFANNISVVNHSTILNYCSYEETRDIIENNGETVVPPEVSRNIKIQVSKFLEAASSKDKEDFEYIKRLEDIAMAIWLITGVEYNDLPQFKSFDKYNLKDKETAKKNWLELISIRNSNLTPCYDLLSIIVKNKGYVPSAEECCEIISLI